MKARPNDWCWKAIGWKLGVARQEEENHEAVQCTVGRGVDKRAGYHPET